MNNYLSLNLVNGRLSRFSGGGRPTFTLNELNSVQMYVLDYPIPTTYPPNSLGDAFGEITTRNFNSNTITINVGVRGSNRIISTSNFFNLPNNFNNTASTSINVTTSDNVKTVSFSGIISLSSVPEQSSLFGFTANGSGTTRAVFPVPFTKQNRSPFFSFDSSFSNIESIFNQTIGSLVNDTMDAAIGGFVNQDCPRVFVYSKVIQNGDYSYSFEYINKTCVATPTDDLGFSILLDSSKASSNYGKYGYLDFSSPNWSAIIGTKKEVPIWMEAMIDNETIAQGNAILCRKMT